MAPAMNGKNLGHLKAVELREVWSDEAREFTPWLAKPENLSILSEAMGDVELETEDTEVHVGSFSSDIVAMDVLSKSRVIIENQLEKTDHGHLGQIITYASGLDAKIIVWIARKFTEEHRQAVDFLNEQTAPNLRIYGVEMKLFAIGDSLPAPEFRVVARPNDYVAQVNSERRGITKTALLYQEFWNSFKDYCEQAQSPLRLGKAPAKHWFTISIGRSNFVISLTANTMFNRIGCEIYIQGVNAKRAFKLLEKDKAEIQKTTGSLDWQELPEKQDCRIALFKQDVDVTDKAAWPDAFKWLQQQAGIFLSVFGPRVKSLDIEAVS